MLRSREVPRGHSYVFLGEDDKLVVLVKEKRVLVCLTLSKGHEMSQAMLFFYQNYVVNVTSKVSNFINIFLNRILNEKNIS
jgi:hypothetical protein